MNGMLIFRMIYFICIIIIKCIFQLRKKTVQTSFILALKICTAHFLKLYHVHVSMHGSVEVKLSFNDKLCLFVCLFVLMQISPFQIIQI